MATVISIGTTGSYKYEMIQYPGYSWKTLAIQFNNYSLSPAQSQPLIQSFNNIYYPSPGFEIAPSIDANTTGLSFTVASSYVTIPSPPYVTVPNNQIINGILLLEGF